MSGNSKSDLTESPSGDDAGHTNVVLVVLDTARAKSVSPTTMPTLSSIGSTGTAFENAFSPAPWTVPSHASLFTGTYPTTHGTHGRSPRLSDVHRTLAEAFADAGYETVGASNNTWITAEFDFDRGFETFRRGWQFVQSDVDMGTVVRAKHLSAKLEAARERLFEGNPLVNAANLLYSEVLQPQGDDGADRTSAWFEDWLEARDDDRPFFCFCNYLEPHVTYRPPREYAERFLPAGVDYETATSVRQAPRAYDVGEYDLGDREFEILRALYRAELAYVDDHIARLRRALVDAGEWENTVFVVCGDHGENVGDHGFFGHQYNLYDTLLHVPLVIRGGPFDDGGRREELVSLLDLPDTLLDVAGIDDAEFRERSRGRSLHPAVDTEPREAVFAEYVSPQPSMETLEDRFGTVPDSVREYDRSLRAVRTAEYKYVRGDDGFERLHRIATDPGERTDVADDRPERVATLRDRLERQFGAVDAAAPAEAERGEVEMRASTKDRLADLGYL